MFENNCHIHEYSPGAGTDKPLGSIVFHLHIYSLNLVSCYKFSPSNDFVTVSPFKCIGDPIRLYRNVQGQPRVIIYMNFVELESLMMHAKFQGHWTSGSGEEDF